ERPVDQNPIDAGRFRPCGLAACAADLGAEQTNHIVEIQHAHLLDTRRSVGPQGLGHRVACRLPMMPIGLRASASSPVMPMPAFTGRTVMSLSSKPPVRSM